MGKKDYKTAKEYLADVLAKVEELDQKFDESEFTLKFMVDEHALDHEMKMQPTYTYFYGDLYVQIQKYYEQAKLLVEQITSSIELELRNSYEGLGKGERPTEAGFKAMLAVDTDVFNAKVILNEINSYMAKLKTAKDAIISKRDMLISMSANQRELMNSELSLSSYRDE